MKQIITILVTLLFLVIFNNVFAKTPTDYHILTADELTIDKAGLITECSYDFTEKKIVIPEEVGGKTITGIKGDLLQGVFENKGITAVSFPATIEIIGSRAFRNNKITLTNISLLPSLITIEANAFLYNSSLSLNLPTNSAVNFNGWRDNNGHEYDAGTHVYDFSIKYEAILAHIITDSEVSMVGNVLASCSYSYTNTDIMIPEYLNGELVTAIWTDCFRSKDITSVLLPPGITLIMGSAFYSNNIQRLDLTRCPNIEIISNAAFGWNDLRSINFSNCSNLQTIRNSAFVSNNLNNVDLSPCNSLGQIEGWTFKNNNLTSFILPMNTNPHFTVWVDEYDNRYQGGDIVSDLEAGYAAIINHDVPVNDTINDVTFIDNDYGCINAIQTILIAEDGNEVRFQNASNVNLIAGQSIRFLPGTVIEPGAYVHAWITDDGTFCDALPESIVRVQEPEEKSREIIPEKEDEFELQTLKVYPNPSDGRFTIEIRGAEGINDVVVYNSMGQLVREFRVWNKGEIELFDVKKGIYLVKVKNSNLFQRIVIR